MGQQAAAVPCQHECGLWNMRQDTSSSGYLPGMSSAAATGKESLPDVSTLGSLREWLLHRGRLTGSHGPSVTTQGNEGEPCRAEAPLVPSGLARSILETKRGAVRKWVSSALVWEASEGCFIPGKIQEVDRQISPEACVKLSWLLLCKHGSSDKVTTQPQRPEVHSAGSGGVTHCLEGAREWLHFKMDEFLYTFFFLVIERIGITESNYTCQSQLIPVVSQLRI